MILEALPNPAELSQGSTVRRGRIVSLKGSDSEIKQKGHFPMSKNVVNWFEIPVKDMAGQELLQCCS